MENEGKDYECDVVMLAYHGQGHINPMIQFAKRLASKGIKVKIATTMTNAKSMQQTTKSITFESIYDDITEGGVEGPGGFKGFLDRFEASGYLNVAELIERSANVKCLVYDANISWALKIAKSNSICSVAFFTQSCGAIASYYPMLFEDESSLPFPAFSMPGLPPPKIPYLASFGSSNSRHSPIIRHILTQFDGIENADWIIFNSFHLLEEDVVKWMSNLWKNVRTIGPTIPSMYLDKRIEDDNAYGFSLYSTDSDDCLTWLNGKEKGSVVYISFGSTQGSNLSSEQMVEVAEAVSTMSTKYSFLWVVKESEEGKLPLNFIEETNSNNQGLIVRWCSQLDVLANEAVGCFVSHCGWNSTMEAISFGVPIIATPQILDQITNAYFVEHVWKVGLQPKMIKSDEVRKCVEQILAKSGEDEKNEITKNAALWREFALQAISEGGSSDKNIGEIIDFILSP